MAAGLDRRWDDTPGKPPGLVYETVLIHLHIDDESGLMNAFVDGQGRLVIGRSLPPPADPVARLVERLTVQVAVGQRIRADGHLDVVDHEALDLMHVEAFVDPGHQQCLRTLGLGAYLPALPDLDGGGHRDEGEDAQGELRHGGRTALSPAADADVTPDLEFFPAPLGHRRS